MSNRKANIITFPNIKGGVAKTSSCHALNSGLRYKGFKTLCIDIDQQSNLSFTMGADVDGLTIYNALKGEIEDIREIIQSTEQGDIIPSNLFLAGADMEFSQTGREYLLKDLIEPVISEYDYIIIDTPPTLGILSINALATCHEIIIPMQADAYSLQGIQHLNATIKKVRRFCNPQLKIEGLLITRFNQRTILSQNVKDLVRENAKQLGSKVFNTCIREGIIIKEIQMEQKSLFANESLLKYGNAVRDYMDFINEYLEGKEKKEVGLNG